MSTPSNPPQPQPCPWEDEILTIVPEDAPARGAVPGPALAARVTVYRVVWTDRQGLHVGSPRFLQWDKAQRCRRLLLRDPDVKEARVVPVVVRPLPTPRPA
jgi:hypothetical protein